MPDDVTRDPVSNTQPLSTISQPVKKRRRIVVLLLLVLIGLLLLAYNHWHKASSSADDSAGSARGKGPMSVQAQTVLAGDLNVFINALGTVVASRNVTVHSRVDGELIKVHFQEGEQVKAGQLLAEIDPRPFQVLLGQAEGQLVRDRALLANARQDMARYNTLLTQDSVSRQQADSQVALVNQYLGAVQSDQAQVDSARLQLSYCRIVAPVAGKLGLRLVDQGNLVHASDATGLVVINQVQPIYVTFSIPEVNLSAVLAQLHAGKTLSVAALARDQQRVLAQGQVLSLDNQIDVTTGTLKVKALFANTADNLFPNQFVNARLLVELRRGVTLIPSAAVQRGSKGTFVFVVDANSQVHARTLTLGPVDGEKTQVMSGLQPGERVVIDGADKLKEGGHVNVVIPTTDAPSQARTHSGGGHKRAGT